MTPLEKAIAERDKFLEDHPNMKEYQKEIDETLDKCREEDRFAVIAMMLSGKLVELQNETINILTKVVGSGR